MKAIFAASLAIASFIFGASAAKAGVVATDATYGMFDNSFATRFLDVGTHGTIADLNIVISFAKCDNPALGPNGGPCRGTDSPYEDEIVFRLTSPGGKVVKLVNKDTFVSGDSGLGQISVSFDDEGAPRGEHVAAGSMRPVDSLADFDGLDMFGRWTLFVHDTTASDPLEYYFSHLDITTVPAAVPEPAPFGLMALGLAGLAAARRRLRGR